MKNLHAFLWVLFGAAYGLAMRVLVPLLPSSANVNLISDAFLVATPVTIGAIVVYGIRHSKPTVWKMIWAPWVAILLALLGSAVALLEGSICIVLAAPLFLGASSIGGLAMGLALRWTNRDKTTLSSFVMLPLLFALVEQPSVPEHRVLEDKVSVEVAATPDRIWNEIKNARNISKDELSFSFVHLIGVPRPLEGVNVATTAGETRYSKWERGVHFSAVVTNEVPNRTITWRYQFAPDSFPKGALDDHVAIGGKYFDLYDTTFNLVPLSDTTTRLEIISHYSVTTGVNFYGVPVAKFIAQDFMTTIVKLYKTRSEKPRV